MRYEDGGQHVVIVWPVNDSSTLSTDDALLRVEWSDRADDADAEKVIRSVR